MNAQISDSANSKLMTTHFLLPVSVFIFLIFAIASYFLYLHRTLRSNAESLAQKQWATNFDRVSTIAGLVNIIFGITVLLGGWVTNLMPRGWLPRPNTAICFLFGGLALSLDRSGKSSLTHRKLARICAAIMLLIGALTVAEFVFNVNFGIDQLLFQDTPLDNSGRADHIPGRMTKATAFNFILTGLAFLLIQHRRTLASGQGLAITVVGLSTLNLIGHLYGVKAIYELAGPTSMTARVSTMFIFLAGGILATRYSSGLIATLSSNAPGGFMARHLMPAALAISIVLGWLRLQGELKGLYDSLFGVALLVSSNIFLFTILIWTSAWLLNQLDIERSQVESNLRNSDASFRQLADAMPQIVWTSTPDGNVSYCNQRWFEYTNMTLAQTTNNGWKVVVHPDDLQRTIDRWTHSLATGEDHEVESRFRRASDGSYRWHLGRATAARNSSGEIMRWFGTLTDIEDYKRAEAAIRGINDTLEDRVRERTGELVETRARLQSILDSATQVAIIATNTNGVIQLFNSGAEKMLQYKAQEIVDVHTQEIFHDRQEILERSSALSKEFARKIDGFDVFVAYARKGILDEREWTYIRKDGSRLDVLLATTSVHNSNGVLIGFLGIATDITTRKSLERDLLFNNKMLAEQTRRAEEANLAKSSFLATMSHEIRTPMNAILGMADLLSESELDADQRQYVEVFRRAGSNLLTLINDILDLSKIEIGHFELEHVDFDLEETIDQVIELIGPKARAKGIILLSRLSPKVVTGVAGDPTRLKQVLINLLGNAVKFTDSGEVILTVSSEKPDRIEFSVSDTGIGIPTDKLVSIFDDFTQADSSTTRKYGGTGLGLAISRRIVERMGGELTVMSIVGKGSTFRFTVSFGIGPDTDHKIPLELDDIHGQRALVIDDSATNRLILQETLNSWGLETDSFESPEEALARLAIEMKSPKPYSLVLVDSGMPEMNGFEVVERIRQIDGNLPAIMLASDSRLGDAARRRELRLSGYAIRPVKRSDLFRLVCNAIKPVRAEDLSPTTANTRNDSIESAHSLNILLAEDSADNRLLLRAYLKSTSHRLTFAENGKEAVDQFRDGSFNLILMDMQMPIMDGLTAARAIREIEKERGLSEIPIIALTANALPQHIRMSIDAGCTTHVSKPVSKLRLLSAIEECMQTSPLAKSVQTNANAILVEMPGGLEELTQEYFTARKEEVFEMMAFLASSDFERLRILGHNMKGTGTSLGFPELTKLGDEMERSAKEHNHNELESQILHLRDYLARVQLFANHEIEIKKRNSVNRPTK